MSAQPADACGGCSVFGLAEEMAMESGAVISAQEMEAARRPFRTGGEVEGSQETAMHSRDAFESMATRLSASAGTGAGAGDRA